MSKGFFIAFLFSLSIEEIDDSRGLDSRRIKTDENFISAVGTSMEGSCMEDDE